MHFPQHARLNKTHPPPRAHGQQLSQRTSISKRNKTERRPLPSLWHGQRLILEILILIDCMAYPRSYGPCHTYSTPKSSTKRPNLQCITSEFNTHKMTRVSPETSTMTSHIQQYPGKYSRPQQHSTSTVPLDNSGS